MKSKKTMIAAVAVLTIGALGAAAYQYLRPTEVKVVKPEFQTMEATILETGTVKYDRTLKIYAQRGGRVENINKKLGDSVNFGEVLVQLDSQSNVLMLKDADAKIAAAKAQLEGTKSVGFANQKDSLSLQISEAKRQVDLAKQHLNDMEALKSNGSVSDSEYKAAKSQFELLESQLSALELNYRQLVNGAPSYQKKLTQAQLDQALAYREQLLYEGSLLQIASPLKGIVLEKNVEEDAFLQPGMPVMTIGDPSVTMVEVDVLADEIAGLNLKDKVRMTAAYLPEITVSGEVALIAPAAVESISSLGISQKRLPVTIRVLDHQALLKPGLPMEVTIVKETRPDVLCVPPSAIFEDEAGDYVLVAEKDAVDIRRVKVGFQSDLWVEVTEGISEEDLVIDSPELTLTVGQKITFEK